MSLLRTHDLTAHYGDFQALFGIDIEIDAGEVVGIIGSNGAGKTTLLKSLVGLLGNPAAAIEYDGDAIGALPAHVVVQRGIALVPEGRRLFPSLSVEENLRMGGRSRRTGPWSLARVYELFPILAERRHTPATALSGGQQQMVAIGRGLMSNPRVLLCDEISLGLAPVVVKDIYAAIPQILAEDTGVVLVEQDISRALGVATRIYCLQQGRVSLAGVPAELTRAQLSAAYFGV